MKPSEKNDSLRLMEFEDSRALCEFMSKASVDAIVTSDSDDLILTWNNGAQQMFGYGREIIGRPVTTLIPEKYRESHINGVKRFLNTGEKRLIGQKAELEAIRKDGTIFPIELSLSSWKSRGRIFFGAIIRDASERKRIEQIREDVYRIIRHDLKSPLIGITGLSRLLLKGQNLTRNQVKAASLIQQQAQRLSSYIDQSQNLYDIIEGRYSLKPEPFNLIDVLYGVSEQLAPLTEKKGITIEIRLHDEFAQHGDEYYISGEAGLIETMLANLIKNAVEASPRNQMVVVNISAVTQDGRSYHHLSIINQGAVPAELRERFFEPYVTGGKKGGTGLGTHSAKLVTQAHHGDIGFTSSESDGTRVYVLIPQHFESNAEN